MVETVASNDSKVGDERARDPSVYPHMLPSHFPHVVGFVYFVRTSRYGPGGGGVGHVSNWGFPWVHQGPSRVKN